jgi:signal peptidase I
VVEDVPPPALTLPARLRGGLGAVLAAVLFALFARGFVLEIRRVTSGSMEPTLLVGDQVLVDRMLFAPRLPRWLASLLPVRAVATGDVVLFRSPEDGRTALVKRCVALPGDLVPAGVVPGSSLYLVGDRRADSHDSRDFGPVDRAAVVGRVVLVLASRAPDGGLRGSRTLRAVR